MSNNVKRCSFLSGETGHDTGPNTQPDKMLASAMDSVCPMAAPLISYPALPTATETVSSNFIRMFSPKPETFGVNPYSSSLPETQRNNNTYQLSNNMPVPQYSPSDTTFIKNLHTSHVGLTSSQGPKPIVTMASCYEASMSQNYEQLYNAKRLSDQETDSPGKKSRLQDTVQAFRNDEPKTLKKPVQKIQAATRSDSNLTTIEIFTEPQQSALLSLTGGKTVQSPAQSSNSVIKTNIQKTESSENELQALKNQLRMETRTEIRVFFKKANKNDLSLPLVRLPFQYFLFNVTNFGNYDIPYEDNPAELCKKIACRLAEVKKNIQNNCTNPSASIALRNDGMDVTSNKFTSKIPNSSIFSVAIDGLDKHLFGVVHRKNSTTVTVSVFSTYTRKTSLEIVGVIERNLCAENNEVRSYFP
ncbi:hypothetical protein CAEBREN_05034 [Caenorhabditis brenneri]|uniref:Uncharacterized protein n=1 Tax=Caenorhabditis brenneri TaxID=135651 RepID=G0MH08_CAEBE|nr:hypothetical protein CAEBREN_05034 [Caenorhabditis brenneri]